MNDYLPPEVRRLTPGERTILREFQRCSRTQSGTPSLRSGQEVLLNWLTGTPCTPFRIQAVRKTPASLGPPSVVLSLHSQETGLSITHAVVLGKKGRRFVCRIPSPPSRGSRACSSLIAFSLS